MNEVITSEKQQAKALHERITSYGNIIMQSFYGLCAAIKEMRDTKLYKALGYDTFEDYTEEKLDIKRRQAYNYIAIAENLTEDFVQSTAQIGVQKLYLLTTVNEEQRKEIVEHTDLENTSVKELQKQLHAVKEREKALSDKLRTAERKITIAVQERDEARREIIDLESRPVEVAVHESHDVENLKKAMQELEHKHTEEMDELRSDYEKRLAEIPQAETVPDTKEVFKAHFTTVADAVNRLFAFVSKHNDQVFVDKTRALIKEIDHKLEQV